MIETYVYADDRNAGGTRHSDGFSSRRRSLQPAAGMAVFIALMFAFGLPTLVRAEAPPLHAAPALRTADLFALATLSEKHFESVPDASLLNGQKIIAFEENPRFVYLVARAERSLRRVVLLKPGTFVVEDRVQVSADETPVQWTLLAEGQVTIDDKKLSVIGPRGELHGETLLPKDATLQTVRFGRDDEDSTEHGAKIEVKADGREARFLHVFQVRRPGDKGPQPRSKLVREDDGWQLTVTVGDQTLKLSLSAEPNAAGTIAIAAADGQSLLNERLLPSGIMPYGEEGVALLKRWDTPYHADRRPGWDVGRVAPELKKVVEKDALGRGRAVVFGCGTGTNAIYLASQGFEVTGVDVAPTALARAAQKAREAGVNVRWVLADVLALPELKPFDFVFDRGCYHHVRQYNAAGYVNSVCRISHPGTRVLILAGSANEERRAGPPKIKEEEIRNDFSATFDFDWLREIRFDSVNPDSKGPLAWSVLLRRKENEEAGFESLFDGKSFEGWRVGPTTSESWKVENGLLLLTGGNSHLFTEEEFGNFIVRFEWRPVKKGYNSGFFIRGRSQIQMAQGGAGMLFGSRDAPGVPQLHKPPGEWNEWEVTCVGPRVSLKVNGQTAWEIHNFKPVRGPLGIEAEGHSIEFRKIQIKRLPNN